MVDAIYAKGKFPELTSFVSKLELIERGNRLSEVEVARRKDEFLKLMRSLDVPIETSINVVGPKSASKSDRNLAARCVAVRFQGDVAVCEVEIQGCWIETEMPARALRHHGLVEGCKFIWWMAAGREVAPGDIDPDVPEDSDSLSPEEQAEFDRLHAKRDEIFDSDIWREAEGDGP